MDIKSKIKKLMEMGFPEDVCTEALERYDGDENLALNFLLGGWTINTYNSIGLHDEKSSDLLNGTNNTYSTC